MAHETPRTDLAVTTERWPYEPDRVRDLYDEQLAAAEQDRQGGRR
ncbi:hypothetical protein AB0F17_65810 [Nonomuraea sp. NPDC026600]